MTGIAPRNGIAPQASLDTDIHVPQCVGVQLDDQLLALGGCSARPLTPMGHAGEFQFNAGEWEQLKPLARVHRCQILAREAETLARGATSRLKTLYLDMAIQWKMLGEAIVLESNRAT